MGGQVILEARRRSGRGDAHQFELVGAVATDRAAGQNLTEDRRLGLADVDGVRAAWVEVAAGRRVRGIGNLAAQHDSLGPDTRRAVRTSRAVWAADRDRAATQP